MSVGELACTYAALILHDDGIPVTAEKIATLVKAANVDVESYWPNLFAKLCEKKNIEDLILNAAGGPAAAAALAALPASTTAPAHVEAKNKEEDKEEEESDEDVTFDLWDEVNKLS